MSTTSRPLPQSFTVGSWYIDGDTLSATRGSTVRTFEPRAYQVLRYLAERPGKLVRIDELMDVHWEGTVVTPNAVTRVVAQIRKVLDDDAKQPTYIQTVARTGYRFVADVSVPGERKPAIVRTIAAAVALVAIAVGVSLWMSRDSQPDASVAVLPFENFTGNPALEYIGEGVAEEIINSLAKVDELSVSSRTMSFSYRDSDLDFRDIARDLDVLYLVEGSVRVEGDKLRFTAQLIDSRDGYHVWSHTAELGEQEIFAGQDAISSQLTAALTDELDITVATSAADRREPHPDAYDLYLRGRYIWHRRGSEPLQPAVNYFAEAVRIDPDYAEGWAALASAYLTWPSYSPEGFKTWRQAEDIAKKAIELDPGLAEPYGALGTFAETRYQWTDARKHFETALENNPRSAVAHHWYVEHLLNTGHINDAMRHLVIAFDLDPTYLPPKAEIGWLNLRFGDLQLGLQSFGDLWNAGFRGPESLMGNFVSAVITGDLDRAERWLEAGVIGASDQALLARVVEIERGTASYPGLMKWVTEELRPWPDHRTIIWSGSRAGQYDEVFDYVRARHEFGAWISPSALFNPGTGLGQQPGIAEVLATIGMVEHWEAVGWGDVCRREASDIVCNAQNVDLSLLESLVN